jgi:hypothetical protein
VSGYVNVLAANAWWVAPVVALAVVVLAGLTAWLTVRVRGLEKQYATLVRGTTGGSLQTVLESHVEEVRSALSKVRDLDVLVHQLQTDARGHVQHVGLVRYNPFRDTGGDQSFVLALADAGGNGAVITSLHMRDVTRIYAKPLAVWNSAYPLTEEEERALRQARAANLALSGE